MGRGVKKMSTCGILKNKNGMIVTYWPSTEPSIKRCTCVNKRKYTGSRCALNNNITRAQTAWVSWRQDASVRISLQTEGRKPSVTHGWATKPRWGRSAAMVARRTWGQYSSLSLSPTHLSHTTETSPFQEWSVRDYIFIKKCVRSFVHWSSSLCLIMFLHIFVYVYVQLYYGYGCEYTTQEHK